MVEPRFLPIDEIPEIPEIRDRFIELTRITADVSQEALEGEIKDATEEARREASVSTGQAILDAEGAEANAEPIDTAFTEIIDDYFKELDDAKTEEEKKQIEIEQLRRMVSIDKDPRSVQLDPQQVKEFNRVVSDLAQQIIDRLDKISSKNTKRVQNLKSASDRCSKAAQDLRDTLQDSKSTDTEVAQKLDALDEAGKELDNVLDDFQTEVEAKGGNINYTKALLKFLKIAGIVGSIFLFLFLMANALSGCYHVKGTLETKLSCPDSKNKAFCDCGRNTGVFIPDNQKFRDKYCTDTTKHYGDYPFCCDSGYTEFCSVATATIGDPKTVFYKWKQLTAMDILNELIQDGADVAKAIDDAVKEVPSVLPDILKYGLIILGVVLGIWLLSIVFKMFSKK